MKPWRMLIALAAIGLLGTPAFAADYPDTANPVNPPRPGTLNYIEGAASLDGRTLNSKNVANIELNAGQELTTGAGKAEILLTPGIFLRVGSNSAVKMIKPALEQTQVELEHGKLGVEVDQIFPQNMVQIIDNGVTTQLMKTGYYEFHTDPAEAMVFDGRAETQIRDGKWEKVKGHHELALAEGVRAKTQSFDSKPTDDDLYNWSKLRSQYLAEANNQIAGDYEYEPGFNPGWYWDPYMWDYTFIGPGAFYSPFGWGFYPWGGWGWGGPFGFYSGGFYGGGFYHHRWYGRGPGGHYYGHGYYGGHGAVGGTGFHGGDHAFGGGGLHGGGGFHGGGGVGGGRR